ARHHQRGRRPRARAAAERGDRLADHREPGRPAAVGAGLVSLGRGGVPRSLQTRRPEAAEHRGEPKNKPEPQLQCQRWGRREGRVRGGGAGRCPAGRGDRALPGEVPGGDSNDRLRSRRLRAGVLGGHPGDPNTLAGVV
ncbi:MAG: hypothetical protein AVDCRST_MAG12-1277, partial [uncultured Rubrobacteraceae bacterium]